MRNFQKRIFINRVKDFWKRQRNALKESKPLPKKLTRNKLLQIQLKSSYCKAYMPITKKRLEAYGRLGLNIYNKWQVLMLWMPKISKT
jgi:hypothetical protein